MQLLIQRRQKVGLFGVKFFLATRLQLTDEETKLVRTYNAREALVFLGDARQDAYKALWYAGGAMVVFMGVHGYTLSSPTGGRALAAIGISPFSLFWWYPILPIVLWVIAYRLVRETVRLGDLIRGRAFKCRSIMDIQEMEEFLKKVAFVIAQMLEDMKNWGGREIVPVAPLIERNYDTTVAPGSLRAPSPVTAPAPSVSDGKSAA